MQSVKHIASIKLAIELCNGPELKREILHLPGTNDDVCDRISKIYYNVREEFRDAKQHWDRSLEKKTTVLLEKLGLWNCLQEKVIGLVLLIGIRMLTWAKYHECVIGFSRDFSISFLKSFFFTSRGIIDNKKAAKDLLKCQQLNIKQRYKLACLYCFVDQIPVLFKQLSKEDQEKFYDAQEPKNKRQHPLIKFWSYSVMDEAYKLSEEQSVDNYLLKIAIESANKSAVEHCLEKKGTIKNETTLINIALKTVNERNKVYCDTQFPRMCEQNKWMIFMRSTDNYKHCDWNPSDYYINVLCFIIDKMNESQSKLFLIKDLEEINNDWTRHYKYSYVLSSFLFWPYQNYFMKAINLTWEVLPVSIYAELLVKICSKMKSKPGSLNYGEGKTFDYRKLLNKFWCDAPLRYKRCWVISEAKKDNRVSAAVFGKYYWCKKFLSKLFLQTNFTKEDREFIEETLDLVTDEEKKTIAYSEEVEDLCLELLRQEKWQRFDVFASVLFSSLEQAEKFCRGFIYNPDAQRICIRFVREESWAAAETMIKRCASSAEEIIRLKDEMIFSENGTETLRSILYANNLKNADMFCEWFISSKDKLKQYKVLFFTVLGNQICSNLVKRNKLKNVDNIISWCLVSDELITQFQEKFVSKYAGEICKHLLSHYYSSTDFGEAYNCPRRYEAEFYGGKWEQVELFLSWCFSSVKEINDFKREVLFQVLGKDIIFSLILANQFQEAETFISWLDLSSVEIMNLKAGAVFPHIKYIYKSVCETLGDKFLSWEGEKWENIKKFLSWCFVDKEVVLEFKNRFKEESEIQRRNQMGRFNGKEVSEAAREKYLSKFYKLIEEFFNCLG